ncbi:MAG: sigma-70 family RNA polymerase sigma factor, partial [Acidimicrobiia bacterium]|nr:sigma-70 family RNA polymerase sigma factor [Acidimicrobiia bacterium]
MSTRTLSVIRAGYDEETEDRELAVGLIDRSEAALAEVYRRNSAAVFGLAKRVLRDETLAEEVVQEVFLRLWNRPEAFEPERGSLRSFLLAHTHGRSIDLIRAESSRRRREEREAWMTAEAGPSIDEEVWQMALADKIRTALSSLPEREREAIELAYF